MKIAILADNEPSFVKPKALSLSKMLDRANIDNHIFFYGNYVLDYPIEATKTEKLKITSKNLFKRVANNVMNIRFCQQDIHDINVLINQLKDFDAIVFVRNFPKIFHKNRFTGIEILREYLNVPIINYGLKFLATQGDLWKKIGSGVKPRNFTGLKRFDWYLAASNISEYRIKKDVHFPVHVIGGDFRSEHLYPEQDDFRVLIDFERPKRAPEREVQIKVLDKLQIPYTILSGTYSHEEIYSIYRKHSAYFLAHREPFGLPIVELQLCGSYILTPYKSWAPSFYINKSIYENGEGDLSSNFVVYDNDPETLEHKLRQLKKQFDARKVIANFRENYPHLYNGDMESLQDFIQKLENGTINHLSHQNYEGMEREIVCDY